MRSVMTTGLLAAAAAAMALPLAAQPVADRGRLLYETHCIACHTTQVHWREQRLARDWDSLLEQVRRWQGRAQLAWPDSDVEAVARHLNERFYGHPMPQQRAGGGGRALTGAG